MVIDLLKIHPMTTLLGGSGKALSNMVHCSDEMAVAMHGYFTDEGSDNNDNTCIGEVSFLTSNIYLKIHRVEATCKQI